VAIHVVLVHPLEHGQCRPDLPIESSRVRSLNLSTSVGIALYEVLRQRRGRA